MDSLSKCLFANMSTHGTHNLYSYITEYAVNISTSKLQKRLMIQLVKYDKISKARVTWEKKKVMYNHKHQLTEKYS